MEEEEKTISDLEFIASDSLTDDMVAPVEDVDNTYSTSLGELRKFLNKFLVVVDGKDFNTMQDDGRYEMVGAYSNAPELGATPWVLEVAKNNSSVIQTAYSISDSKLIYRRYFNGVSWGEWVKIGDVDIPFIISQIMPDNTAEIDFQLTTTEQEVAFDGYLQNVDDPIESPATILYVNGILTAAKRGYDSTWFIPLSKGDKVRIDRAFQQTRKSVLIPLKGVI